MSRVVCYFTFTPYKKSNIFLMLTIDHEIGRMGKWGSMVAMQLNALGTFPSWHETIIAV